MSETTNSELEAMVDDLMGGEAKEPDHSPEAESVTDRTPEQIAPETDEIFSPEKEETAVSDSAKKDGTEKTASTPEKDSVPEEKTDPDREKLALQQEINNYKKRLHDTQKAMHEANTAKAELQKELDSLKQKKSNADDNDNWFSEEGSDGAIGKIEKELAEVKQQSADLKKQQQQYREEMLRQQWLKEADDLAKEHSDFEKLVYEQLEPLVNEETGDPIVRALYMQQEDRSPAGAYAFAKKYFAAKAKISGAEPEATPGENKTDNAGKISSVGGKAGLDRMNSAEFAEERKIYTNMVDEVFG